MVQRSQNLGFTLKPRQPLRVGRECFGEDLERHLTLELRFGGPIDLAHPALADQGGDIVMAESGANVESHDQSGSTSAAFTRPPSKVFAML